MTLLSSASLESFLQLIGVIIVFILVLTITYLTTRWIAGYQKSQSRNKNLKVIETLRLMPNKYIQIIQAGEVFLVIAVGKDEVHLLAELSREQLEDISVDEEAMESIIPMQFQEALKNAYHELKNQIPKK